MGKHLRSAYYAIVVIISCECRSCNEVRFKPCWAMGFSFNDGTMSFRSDRFTSPYISQIDIEATSRIRHTNNRIFEAFQSCWDYEWVVFVVVERENKFPMKSCMFMVRVVIVYCSAIIAFVYTIYGMLTDKVTCHVSEAVTWWWRRLHGDCFQFCDVLVNVTYTKTRCIHISRSDFFFRSKNNVSLHFHLAHTLLSCCCCCCCCRGHCC